MRTGINILAHGSMIKERVLVLIFRHRKIDMSWIIHLRGDRPRDGHEHISDRTVIRSRENQQGSWHNDQIHGRGTYSTADGDQYEGDWVEGHKDGSGTYKWKNGDRYEFFYSPSISSLLKYKSFLSVATSDEQ